MRNRFQANRSLRSPRLLKLSFFAGYKAIDHLDGAVAGDAASIERIATSLIRVPEYLKQPPKVKPPPPERDSVPYGIPPEHKFLNNFPRQSVDGERRVPFYVRANGFPMVRYKKPQPETLSRTLRQLITQKQKRFDRIQSITEFYLPVAENEDKWDKILAKQFGSVYNEQDGSWAAEMQQALEDVNRALKERTLKSQELGAHMLGIVNQEQQLADEEALERAKARVMQAASPGQI